MPVAVVVLGASIVAGCSVAIASASCCAGIAGIAKRSDVDDLRLIFPKTRWNEI